MLPAQDWSTVPIGDLYLTHGPDLPAIHVIVDGEQGILLGWPIHTTGDNRYSLKTLPDIGGRWALITATYVMPDPLASYSIVYSPEHRIVAASPIVIPNHLLKEDENLNKAIGLPETDHWYPFGLTPWMNLSRLLPERVLELHSFTTARQQKIKRNLDDNAAIQIISETLKDTTRKLSTYGEITILTTAGNDSRIVLAATRDADNVELLTFSSRSSLTDVQVASRLGRFTSRAHATVPVRRDETLESAWFEVVGRCVAGATLRSSSIKLNLPFGRQYLKGIGGEIGRRTNYYRPGDEERRSITPEALVHRLHLPAHHRLHEAARVWLDETTDYNDVAELIEIVYRENRIGAWASPQLHGDSIGSVWIFPINQQVIIDSLRFLSPSMKNSRVSGRLIIENLWPELLSIPINPLSPKEKTVKLARRLKARLAPGL